MKKNYQKPMIASSSIIIENGITAGSATITPPPLVEEEWEDEDETIYIDW